jgi:hypothetical protein
MPMEIPDSSIMCSSKKYNQYSRRTLEIRRNIYFANDSSPIKYFPSNNITSLIAITVPIV